MKKNLLLCVLLGLMIYIAYAAIADLKKTAYTIEDRQTEEITPVIIFIEPEEETTELPTTETPTIEETTELSTAKETIEPPDLNIPLKKKIQSFIYEKCNFDDDMYCFIIAVIKAESNFDTDAVSYDGHDHGLMQLRDYYYDSWAKKYNVDDPAKTYDNITVGVSMLQEYIEKYEYKNLALMAYNCGEEGAKRLWEQGIYSTEYSRKVTEYYESFRKEQR